MKLINRDKDWHMHSLNWSDGMNTVDELVQFAGKIGLKEIAITDHSMAENDFFKGRVIVFGRGPIGQYENVHNDVKVIFGVEADLLNEEGEVCFKIKVAEEPFVVLSAHASVYKGDRSKITDAYINAIRRFHDRINIIGHLDADYFENEIDMLQIIQEANKYNIPLEFNCKNYLFGWNNSEHTRILLDNADQVMLNSDAHCLADLRNREKGFAYLKEQGYIDK